MTQLVDLTRTLGSGRVVPVPGLVGVSTEPLHTHESHARSNTKLTRSPSDERANILGRSQQECV